MSFALKSFSVPITIEDRGPRQWKRYRHKSGQWYWRNYRREVKGGVSLGERFALAVEEQAREVPRLLGRMLR